MINLYGLRMSNYYSLVKALMIEKGVEFEEVKAPPTQEVDNLERSPMGKMPSIGVDGRYLSESLAIAQYLEQIAPTPALLPSDALEAAKVMELVCHVKLDVLFVGCRRLSAFLLLHLTRPVQSLASPTSMSTTVLVWRTASLARCLVWI